MKAGNDLIAAARPFQGEAYRAFIDELLTVEPFALESQVAQSANPIFIIGQPRSGTTLVEQILASHPEVDATDELSFMGHRGADLQRDGGYAAALQSNSEGRWATYQQQYLDIVLPYCEKGGTYFLDKTPKLLHVPLILKILPNARFVHVIRDPLDNIVSQYRHFFPEAGNTAIASRAWCSTGAVI